MITLYASPWGRVKRSVRSMETLSTINFLMAAVFAACYCYQVVFAVARLLKSGGGSPPKSCAATPCSSPRGMRAPSSPSCWRASGGKITPRIWSTFTWWRTTAPTTPRKSPRPAGPGFSSARISCRWARASRCGFCCKKSRRSTPRSTTTATLSLTPTTCWTPAT